MNLKNATAMPGMNWRGGTVQSPWARAKMVTETFEQTTQLNIMTSCLQPSQQNQISYARQYRLMAVGYT